jgi:hypothetical protein
MSCDATDVVTADTLAAAEKPCAEAATGRNSASATQAPIVREATDIRRTLARSVAATTAADPNLGHSCCDAI